MKDLQTLEPLEARIAPAALTIINHGKGATFTDVDGDTVTVAFSKGILTDANLNSVLVTADTGVGEQLQTIDLTALGSAAKGINITVTAKPTATAGDGLVNVGEINAAGVDLGVVKINGDLDSIIAGADSGVHDMALTSLAVKSMGLYGLTTGGFASPYGNHTGPASAISGSVGKIVISGDMIEENFNVVSLAATNPPTNNVGSFTIGGAATGTVNAFSAIYASGKLGPVKVGGTGTYFSAYGNGSVSSVKIGGEMDNGEIYSPGKLGSVSIGGDVNDAEISGASGGSITIGGTITGNEIYMWTGNLGTVKIGGSVNNAEIASAAGTIGSITINGSLENGATIASHGNIASITVKGSVANSKIEVGFETIGTVGSLQLGKLQVGGDWIASDVAVGVQNAGTPPNTNFGDANDTVFVPAGDTARIASIVIAGQVIGTADSVSSTDHFGFVAEQIVSMKVGGVKVPLNAGAENDDRVLGTTGDVTVHEVGTAM